MDHNKIALIVLTYKRLNLLDKTITDLLNQTYSNFDIFIIHNDSKSNELAGKIVSKYKDLNRLKLFFGENKYKFFTRHFLARDLAKDGYSIIFLLDDDVSIPSNYIERSLNQYEPRSYKSGHALSFVTNPPSYSNRKKYETIAKDGIIGYCGAGMSMIDSSIYLNEDFFDKTVVESLNDFDDIWLSAFCLKKGWKLNYLDSGAILGGEDQFASYKKNMPQKGVFVNILLENGFKFPIDSGK